MGCGVEVHVSLFWREEEGREEGERNRETQLGAEEFEGGRTSLAELMKRRSLDDEGSCVQS